MNACRNICEEEYVRLVRELELRGIDEAAIEKSARELCRHRGGLHELLEVAFLPTGVALGCPLPSENAIKLFADITCRFAEFMVRICEDNRSSLAFVPPKDFHVTIVNFRHFDIDRLREVRAMGKNEVALVKDALRAHRPGSIRVVFKGLILTSSGRLIVPGYPVSDEFFLLRNKLADIPNNIFKVNLPRTAHIKTGHLIQKFARERLEAVIEMVERLGKDLRTEIEFKDLFTPKGRVILG